VNFRLELPHTAFHRQIGEFANVNATPKGVIVSDAEWAKIKNDYLPSTADGDFISSLMEPISEPGKFAGWIAPPKVGIDNKPGDFEYVKIAA
jgi:benzoyl-CoA 2,3-dioxygenase component B